MEHRETFFDFWGTGEQANLFHGIMCPLPPPLWGPRLSVDNSAQVQI